MSLSGSNLSVACAVGQCELCLGKYVELVGRSFPRVVTFSCECECHKPAPATESEKEIEE